MGEDASWWSDEAVSQAANFYLPWATAAAVAANVQVPNMADATIIHFEGMSLPLVQSVLAIAGVLLARPLARKKESTLPRSHFVIVSLIMMIIALAWVASSEPNVLFTFVVAIGLGFSGYSLVEQAGAEMQAFVTRIFAMATDALSNIGAKK
jgi:hypothetical protein